MLVSIGVIYGIMQRKLNNGLYFLSALVERLREIDMKNILFLAVLVSFNAGLYAADDSVLMRLPALSLDDADAFVSLDGRVLETPSVGIAASPDWRSPSTITALALVTPAERASASLGTCCEDAPGKALQLRRYRSLCRYLELAIITRKYDFQRCLVALIEKWIVSLSAVSSIPVTMEEIAFWWANVRDTRLNRLAISVSKDDANYTAACISTIAAWVTMGVGDVLTEHECGDFYLLQEPLNLAGLRHVASTSDIAQGSDFAETYYDHGVRVTWPSARPSNPVMYRTRSNSI